MSLSEGVVVRGPGRRAKDRQTDFSRGDRSRVDRISPSGKVLALRHAHRPGTISATERLSAKGFAHPFSGEAAELNLYPTMATGPGSARVRTPRASLDVGTYMALVQRVVGRRMSGHEVEDVTQEALIRLGRAFQRDETIRNAEALATKIAHDAVIDHRRYVERRPAAPLDPASEELEGADQAVRSPETEALARVEMKVVWEFARSNLTSAQYETLEALYASGGDVRDAKQLLCRELGVSAQAIEKRIARMMERLQRHFTPE